MMGSIGTNALLDRRDAEVFAERLRWVILLESPNPMLRRGRFLKSERSSLGMPKYKTILGH